MADPKDQRSDPPVDPSFIPLEKGAMAEKSLHGSNEAPESNPEHDSESKSLHGSEEAPESKPEHDPESSDSGDDKDMIDGFAEELKKKKLDELNRNAFYSVLLAFKLETSKIGKRRTQTIEDLMKEWDIAHETRVSFEDNIKKNLTPKRQRVDSGVKETQRVEAKPLTISEKKPTLFPTRDATTPRSSWGRVTPEALVGRRVLLRLPCEDHFEDLVIKEYNAKDEMHRVASESNTVWMDEMLSWMDLRQFPPEDIKWENGEDPNFETPGSGAED